jgi:hypothetical protein
VIEWDGRESIIIGGAGVDDAVERTISPSRLLFEPTGQLFYKQGGGRVG